MRERDFDYDPAELHALRDALIKEFGYTDTTNPERDNNYVRLDSPDRPYGIDITDHDGERYSSYRHRDGKFHISVNFKNELINFRSSNGDRPPSEINVSKAKPVATIIKEIKRRLFEANDADAVKRLERKAASDDREARDAARLAEYVAAAAPESIEGRSSSSGKNAIYVNFKGVYLNGFVQESGIHLTGWGDLPHWLAIEVMKLIGAKAKEAA